MITLANGQGAAPLERGPASLFNSASRVRILGYKKRMPGKTGRLNSAQHPEIALGGLIAFLTLIVGLIYGFASPALGWWLTMGSAYWAFVLPVIPALKEGWSLKAGLVTAGAALTWTLVLGFLTPGGAGTTSSILALFSLYIGTVIQALRKTRGLWTLSRAPSANPFAGLDIPGVAA